MKESADENDKAKAFAVEVKAFRIDWILRMKDDEGSIDHGYQFMEALHDNDENLEIFGNSTTTMIIEYFYMRFHRKLLMPFFVINALHILFFLTAIYAVEKQYKPEFTMEDLDNFKCGYPNIADPACYGDYVVDTVKDRSMNNLFIVAATLNFIFTVLEGILMLFEFIG